jgi:hypothetical protein
VARLIDDQPELDLWSARREAQAELDHELQADRDIIYETFAILDATILGFSSRTSDSNFARACALAFAKARNLAHGCFSLALDGLGQEAGALYRPLIEVYELAVYLRLDPRRAEEALTDCLPSAGKIAQAIAGDLKPVRDYLNRSASHLAFDLHSLRHLVDPTSFAIRTQQPHMSNTFWRNVRAIYVFMSLLNNETVHCLQTLLPTKADDLAVRVERCRERGDVVFKLREAISTEAQ